MIAAALASRYRPLVVLGRGGMGTVEAALEIDGSRVVALKRLVPEAARDKRRAEMFLREAKVAKLLDHPNVVRAFDFGEIEGELYLAMEYVEGQPLSRVLRALADAGEALSPAIAAYVLAEVCEGLHAAHELRDASGQALHLVHRDVSPQNVMLGYDGRVRLLDFGVAKIETETVTKTGEVKGKTAYMSPEQAMGEPLDRRSDLFGVGAVLYECLSRRRMWGDGTDMEIIRKLALEEPPPLDAPDVPERMRALYNQLVARDAKDRPATARAVADALAALVPEGKETAARELAAILEARFGAQAAELRRELSASLDEAAPAEAADIRASLAPSVRPPPPRRSPLPWIAGAAAAAIGAVALAALARQPPPTAVPPPEPAPSASVAASAPAASAAPAPEPPAPPSSSSSPEAPEATAARPPPRPAVTTPKPAAPKPARSAKPSDVIQDPF